MGRVRGLHALMSAPNETRAKSFCLCLLVTGILAVVIRHNVKRELDRRSLLLHIPRENEKTKGKK